MVPRKHSRANTIKGRNETKLEHGMLHRKRLTCKQLKNPSKNQMEQTKTTGKVLGRAVPEVTYGSKTLADNRSR
jgi:hypothetical protein